MSTRTMHFTIGANFGILMGNIAQEHLIYGLDPIKALETFTKSFVGMSEEIALGLLTGKDFVLEPNENCEVFVRPREAGDKYPVLDADGLIERFILQTVDEAKNFGKSLSAIYQTPNCDRNFLLDLSFSYDELLSLFEMNGKSKSDFYESLKDRLEDMKRSILEEDPGIEEELQCKVELSQAITEWKAIVDKKVAVIRWLVEKGLGSLPKRKKLSDFRTDDEWLEYDRKFMEFSEMLEEVYLVVDMLAMFNRERKPDLSLPFVPTGKDDVDDFLLAERVIDSLFKDKLRPIPPTEYRDAIWVSPAGKMYGLNGTIANMLHCQIADKLVQDSTIKYDKRKAPTVDSYLEYQGWLKIHGDWIMFDPYAKSRDLTTVSNFITEEQTVVVAKYLQTHFNGKGKFGIKHNPISAGFFKSMDKIMKNRLFTY